MLCPTELRGRVFCMSKTSRTIWEPHIKVKMVEAGSIFSLLPTGFRFALPVSPRVVDSEGNGRVPATKTEVHMKRILAFVGLMGLLSLVGCGGGDSDTTEAPPQTVAGNLTGTWRGNWTRSDGREEGTLVGNLAQSDATLSGTMTFTSLTFSYSRSTSLSGNVGTGSLVFGIAITSGGSTITIDFSGAASDDNHMSGTYTMSTGYSGTWSATRTP